MRYTTSTISRPFALSVCVALTLVAGCERVDPAADDDDSGQDVAADSGLADIAVGGDAAGDPVDTEDTDAEDTPDAAVEDADGDDTATGDVNVDVESNDAGADTATGPWDPGDDRVRYTGRCADIGSTCDSGELVECACTRDGDLQCTGLEEYRTDCSRVFDSGVCQETDGQAHCAVPEGGQCYFRVDEANLPPLNELVGLILVEPDATALIAECAGIESGCLLESDGVARCSSNMPACHSDRGSEAFPAVGECTGAESATQVLLCRGLTIDGEGFVWLGLECAPDTCGSSCSGLSDGMPCTAARTVGNGLRYTQRRLIPCGPFSECGVDSELCERRSCDPAGVDGTCTNPEDCGALVGGLEAAFDTLLACAESVPLEEVLTCLQASVPVSDPCGECFLDFEGDFEACAGF